MSESFNEEIVRRVFRKFLDIMVLRLVEVEPMWGYKIIKYVRETYGVELRHGVLYPLLNTLESKGFLRSEKKAKKGRIRRVYEITSKGIQFVDTYDRLLQKQLENTKSKRKE